MASNFLGRLAPAHRDAPSFYEELRNRDHDRDDDIEAALNVDEENFRHGLNEFDSEDIAVADSRTTLGSTTFGPRGHQGRTALSTWKPHDDDIDNDVPASLLVEHNDGIPLSPQTKHEPRRTSQRQRQHRAAGPSTAQNRPQWDAASAHQPLHNDTTYHTRLRPHARSLMAGHGSGGPRERALWRWVNVSNLDGFMKDVYDYFEGGGFACILLANALRLL